MYFQIYMALDIVASRIVLQNIAQKSQPPQAVDDIDGHMDGWRSALRYEYDSGWKAKSVVSVVCIASLS
jgi:hypothetical protein